MDKQCDRDLTWLNIAIIQNVIDFKWETYTKRFYYWEFLALLIFSVFGVADTYIGAMVVDDYTEEGIARKKI